MVRSAAPGGAHPTVSDGLLRAIHEAAFEPAGWDDVLRALTHDLDADESYFSVTDWSAAAVADSQALQTRPAWAQAYREMAFASDCWLDGLHEQSTPGTVYASDDLARLHRGGGCNFSAGFVLRLDRFHALDGVLDCDAGLRASVSVCRESARADFEPAQADYLQAVIPDLQRAMLRERAMAFTSGERDRLAALLDRIQASVFWLEPDSTVVYANHRGNDTLVHDGRLQVANGRLTTDSTATTRRLHRLVHQIAEAPGDPPGGGPPSVLIHGADGREPLLVLLRPAQPNAKPAATGPRPVIALVHNFAASDTGSPDALADAFGLTTAEARLAALLVGEHSLEQAAAELDVSLATVRKHLQHLFRKTATHRQADLLHRLSVVAAIA